MEINNRDQHFIALTIGERKAEESSLAKEETAAAAVVSILESEIELKLRFIFFRSLYFLLSARKVYATMMYSMRERKMDTGENRTSKSAKR